MNKVKTVWILSLTGVLGGCTAMEPETRPPEQVLPESQAQVMPEGGNPLKTTDQMLAELAVIQAQPTERFRLGKGDVISVSVYDEPDLTIDQLPVRPDGQISFPLVGDIPAEGLLVEEIRDSLRAELTRYIRDPRVTVIVKQFNSLNYTLAGEVNLPGSYPVQSDVKLTEAIAAAGGFTKGTFHASSVELADLSHAFLSRDGEYLPVDFVQLFRNGDLRFDLNMRPGDYVFIPSGLAKEIYILGEVNNPDLVAFNEGYTVINAIAQGKGFTPDAASTRVHVVRGSLTNPELYVLNMEDVLKGKQRDITLKAGDIVYVPPTGLTQWNRILSKLIPSVTTLQTGLLLQRTVNGR